MPFPNVHAARQSDPAGDLLRRSHPAEFPEGVDAFMSGSTLSLIHFDAEKWTVEAAKKWLGEKGMLTEIEPATKADKLDGHQVRFDQADAPCRLSRRYDFAELAPPSKTKHGFLRAQGMLTRVGVFTYRRADGTTVREYRPPEEVFRADSLRSFALVPLTLGHPDNRENVTPENAQKFTVGAVGAPEQAGEHVRADMLITRKDAIAAVEGGRNKLSCGYDCFVIDRPGVYVGPDGKEERFDAVQTMIRGNHVAIVDTPRAGPSAQIRIDSADAYQYDGREPPQEERTVKIIIEGKEHDVPDAVAAELKKRTDDSTKVQELEGKIAAMEATKKTDAAESEKNSRVKERVKLINRCAPFLTTKADEIEALHDLSDVELMRKVIAKRTPDLKLDGKDDVFVRAAFEVVMSQKVDTSTELKRITEPGRTDGGDWRAEADKKREAASRHAANQWKPDALRAAEKARDERAGK